MGTERFATAMLVTGIDRCYLLRKQLQVVPHRNTSMQHQQLIQDLISTDRASDLSIFGRCCVSCIRIFLSRIAFQTLILFNHPDLNHS
jgi:hypothetical protein